MPHKVISIKPRKKKSDSKQILTSEQLSYIQTVLEQSLPPESKSCISRSQLYEELQEELGLEDVEQYHFERSITDAIKDNLLHGFETRNGRNGGICRKGAFKTTSKKKASHNCTVTINGTTYKVQASEAQVFAFIISVLEAKPTNDGKNAIYINNGAYKLPSNINPSRILENFVSTIYKAQTVDEIKDGKI